MKLQIFFESLGAAVSEACKSILSNGLLLVKLCLSFLPVLEFRRSRPYIDPTVHKTGQI